MPLEIDFELVRDAAGEVIGFQLISQPETYSEEFCAKFPRALTQKRAQIKSNAEENSLAFVLLDTDQRLEVSIEPADLAELRKNVLNPGAKLRFELAGHLTEGFKIIRM